MRSLTSFRLLLFLLRCCAWRPPARLRYELTILPADARVIAALIRPDGNYGVAQLSPGMRPSLVLNALAAEVMED